MEYETDRPGTGADRQVEPCLVGGSAWSWAVPDGSRGGSGLARKPAPIPGGWGRRRRLPLRNSDEQTIAGLCAVFTAIERMRLPRDRYDGWGVIAASRFLGRANLARALQSFLAEGVWGTSPHLIPHFALHSASGTISLGLGLHGPNLGVGGGLHAAAEGFLTALTWLSTGRVPGVWLVLSGWSPELIPDRRAVPRLRPIARLWQLPWPRPVGHPAGLRFGLSSATRPRAATAPVDLLALETQLTAPAEARPWLVASDPLGRLRIELTEGPTGQDEGT